MISERMKPLSVLAAIAMGLCVVSIGPNAIADLPPSFDEVSGLIRSNLAGTTAEQLDQMAVDGLLKELNPRVALVDHEQDSIHGGRLSRVVEARVYRENVGYLRLARIADGTSDQLLTRLQDLKNTNQLSGLVVDLRMATGDDYAAALRVADLFLSQEVPLLNWGEGLKSSSEKTDAITLPVAMLVNGQTGGGAEAVAAMLRQSGVALLIGAQTEGTAGIQRAFELTNGQFLKITVANIQLGNAQLLSTTGIKPDVAVEVSPEHEAALLNGEGELAEDEGSEGDIEMNGSPTRTRMNEADLVRRWRGEMLSDEDLGGPDPEDGPETRDPALLRALDLMDGLAILRSWQKTSE